MAESGRKRGVRVAMSVAAVGVATSVVGVAATQPASISTPLVDLAALIVVGSSTNWDGAGVVDFFHGKFNDPIYTGPNGDDITYVNFLSGPLGIKAALEANAGEHNAVLAGGWGAANVGLLLSLQDPAFNDTVVVMDRRRRAPRRRLRHPLSLVLPDRRQPHPHSERRDCPRGREHRIRVRLQLQRTRRCPESVRGSQRAGGVSDRAPESGRARLARQCRRHTVGDMRREHVRHHRQRCSAGLHGRPLQLAGGPDHGLRHDARQHHVRHATRPDELPLTKLIRQFLGDRIANIANPLLKLAVDSAYYGGNPIPTDPSAYRPGAPLPVARGPADDDREDSRRHSGDPGGDHRACGPCPGVTEVEDHRGRRDQRDASDRRTSPSRPSDDTIENTKPLTNVVRDSVKATPGEVGELATHADGHR